MNRFCLLLAGLAPLLGATRTLAQATVVGISMLVLTVLHQALLHPVRSRLSGAMYGLASLLLLAALSSCLLLALRAWALPLALALGSFPALICLQCLATDRLLPDSGRWRQLWQHVAGLLVLCLLLGASRQWLADGLGVYVAKLAPGALLMLGVLLALYNWLRPGPAPSRRQGKR
ncbi:Rnf-Nqr domain containing protein [Pseudomonas sp. NPDC090233]|uniref:Rnf-Nqr domain containing protein n=1 Tax=Pseudomonas sp. NPDC090233 TaxID=3364479 RepID=UPI00383B5664